VAKLISGKLSIRALALGAAAALAAGAAALASPAPANAGLLGGVTGLLLGPNCGATTQPFAPWGDFANYFPAPDGSFEQGGSGWILAGGARVVSGNSTYSAGHSSLSLPSGSVAISPPTCIGTLDPTIRMFGVDPGSDSGLQVKVVFGDLLGGLVSVLDYGKVGKTGTWAPTSKVLSLGSLPLGSRTMQVILTPSGSGSAWRVDDLYVDPARMR
jgi:hypothetical protein